MTIPKKERIRVGLRIPLDLNTKLILQANELGVSKNALILNLLWASTDSNDKRKDD